MIQLSKTSRSQTPGLYVAVFGILLFFCSPATAQEAANLRMQRVAKEFAVQTNHQVVGLGSWISSGDYKPGVSDHDMRLVLPKGTSETQAIEQWKKSREVLRDLIKKEFGPEADKYLKSTNLYPPSQVMQDVEDAGDAARKFEKMNAVPTLSQTGPVDAKTAGKYSEGLYGKGSKAWTQNYEAAKGKLFYSYKGKGYSGMTDLTHLAEGQEKFTSSGMGNTARGWLDHAVDEAKKLKPDRVAKYLERVERDLNKARDLSRLGENTQFNKELRSLIDDLKKPGALMSFNEKRFGEIVRKARLEANLLSKIDDAGVLDRELIETMLRDLQQGGKFSEKVMAATEKVPFGKIFDGLVMVLVAQQAGQTAGERSIAEAVVKAIPQLATLPAGLLSEITDQCLQSAKEGGATMVANRQEAWDLIAGIHTARGREQGFRRSGDKMEYELDDLVRNIHTRSKLEAFVYARAAQSASRDGGEALSEGDKGVMQAIFDRCFPVIYQAWLAKREMYRREYIRQANILKTAEMVIAYAPNPASMPSDGKPLKIRLHVVFPNVDMGKVMSTMRNDLTMLAGSGTFVNRYVKFNPAGTDSGTEGEVFVSVPKPGNYKASVKVRYACGGTNLGENEFLNIEIVHTAEVIIEVEPPQAADEGTFVGKYGGGDGPSGDITLVVRGTSVTGTISISSKGQTAPIQGAFDPAKGTLTGSFSGKLKMPVNVNGSTEGGINLPGYSMDLEVDVKGTLTGQSTGNGFKGTIVLKDGKNLAWYANAGSVTDTTTTNPAK